MSGQSLTDRITAAQHSVTGSAVSKTVCKATTHEVMGPKKKHLDCESDAVASSSSSSSSRGCLFPQPFFFPSGRASFTAFPPAS